MDQDSIDNAEQWNAIIQRGGKVVAHPDTIAEMEKSSFDTWFKVQLWRAGDRLLETNIVERGSLLAVDYDALKAEAEAQLAKYLERTIAPPFGMERDADWILSVKWWYRGGTFTITPPDSFFCTGAV